jgi:hypothetical protein
MLAKETQVRSLLAHIASPPEATDRRRTERRTLRLDAAAHSSTQETAVIIRNLSRTGLLIETDAFFALGETFILILPELGAAPARVVREEGRSLGCEFLSPVPASAISAALLKAPHDKETGGIVQTATADAFVTARPLSAFLFTVLTALFTAMVLLFIVALATLNFSSD